MIILIVNYNRPDFLSVQLELIAKNLQPLSVHVINTGDANNECKAIASRYDAKYTHLYAGTKDFSQCHALALNVGYSMNRQLTDIIGILDHDCFPMQPIDIRKSMGYYDFFAANQIRENISYPNPACMFMRTNIGNVDFMPVPGLDTAGQLWTIYDNVQPMTYEVKDDYEVFADTFLHIVKGSNWVDTSDNRGRVERVFNYVKTFV